MNTNNKKPIDPRLQPFFVSAHIGDSDQKKLNKRLPVSIDFMQSIGVGLDDVPTEENMKQLEAYLRTLKQEKGRYKGKGYEDTTITDWLNRTRDFFNFRNGNRPDNSLQLTIDEAMTTDNSPKGEMNMSTPDNSTITAKPETDAEHEGMKQLHTPDDETEAINSTLETSEKKPTRMGAPRKSSEVRSKKLTIYITPSLEADVKDLAHIEGKTTPDYIFRLIEREATKRANDLELIRNMRQQNM